jgi:uncharacterized membrane protein YuzA (DUF378 family)
MIDPDDNPTLYLLATILAGAGALNWGAREFLDTDLLTETLQLDPTGTTYTVVVGAIAAGGILTLYSEFWWSSQS